MAEADAAEVRQELELALQAFAKTLMGEVDQDRTDPRYTVRPSGDRGC